LRPVLWTHHVIICDHDTAVFTFWNYFKAAHELSRRTEITSTPNALYHQTFVVFRFVLHPLQITFFDGLSTDRVWHSKNNLGWGEWLLVQERVHGVLYGSNSRWSGAQAHCVVLLLSGVSGPSPWKWKSVAHVHRYTLGGASL